MSSRSETVKRVAAVLLWVAAIAISGAVASSSPAQEPPETRLIDREPFDELTLKAEETPIKLQPLALEPRRPLRGQAADSKVRVRLFDRPQQQYEVTWADIASLKLFEELVMGEAAALVQARKFDEAYPYYVFLEKNYAKFPGVPQAFQQFLFQEAKFWQERGRLDQSLALLTELHARNASFEGLEAAMGEIVDALVARHLAASRYTAARRQLADLKARFPEHAVVKQREQQLVDEATAALAAAQAAQGRQKWREAHEAAAAAVAKFPDLPGAKELLREIQSKYSIISVGVTRLAGPAERLSLDGWTARRQARLLHRMPAEQTALTPGGPKFISPVGAWAPGETGTLELAKALKWSGGAGEVTSYDVARQLATVPAGFGSSLWTIKCGDGSEAVATGPDGHSALAQAAWQFPLVPWHFGASAGDAAPPVLGPYLPGIQAERETRYLRNGDYFALETEMASEIIERQYDAEGVVAALLRGEAAAIDRVPPWEAARLRTSPDVTVAAYAAPSVHFLVMRPGHPLLGQRWVRRALLYGIHRERILSETLLGAADVQRGSVAAGPLASGAAGEPLRYDPRQMLAMLAAAGAAGGRTGPPQALSLVLAHPPTETARRACKEIQQQLGLEGKGVAIQLYELPDDGLEGALKQADRWDLAYVERMAANPAADAVQLLGHEGIAWTESPALVDALARLARAPDWAKAQEIVGQIDRLAAEELPVLPLWQLTEFFAHDKRLAGVGAAPLVLYQNVEQWRLGPAAN
ncbi:MAG: hypothetical protein HYS13_05225 [Planctomycetia bacterium]|nr:hypothetical protein [Planctomycetia bacterium]